MPHGPEKPRTGLQDLTGTGETKAEIFWDPPKGEFTKYILDIEKINNGKHGEAFGTQSPSLLSKTNSIFGLENMYEVLSLIKLADPCSLAQRRRHIDNLSYKLSRYTIMGLEPAEAYLVILGTKTGMVCLKDFIKIFTSNSNAHFKL